MNRENKPSTEYLRPIKNYVERGWKVVPIPKGEKGTIISKWQNLRLCEKDLPKYFSAESNIGVLLGEPSAGLVDIDLDRPEAAMLAEFFLPPTGAVFGRQSKPSSHFLYTVSESIKTKMFKLPPGWSKDAKKGMVIEIRSTGVQTVFPGSVHPSGEKIRWDKNGDPLEITADDLMAAVLNLFKASLKVYVIKSALGNICPDDYDTWLKVGMALHHWQDNTAWAQDIGFRIWDEWSRESSKYNGDEMQMKWDSFNRKDAEEGNQVTLGTLFHYAFESGWIKLPDQDKHVEWSDNVTVGDDIILKYNKNHAVAMISGKCVVIKEDTDPLTGRDMVLFCSPTDFHNFYANSLLPSADGRLRQESRLWFAHTSRRTYTHVVFDPTGKAGDTYYNLWKGFAVIPQKGDWSLMRRHIKKVICQGNKARFDYLMAWMARIVQQPGGDRPGVAVVLCGGQGTGKGIFVRHFGSIFGAHYLHLTSQKALTGDFNDHFKNAVVVFADESFFAGDKASVGQLKGLITEPTNLINTKYINRFTVANNVNLIMASNELWVVPAEEDERRFFVMAVSEDRKGDHEYFANLEASMRNGGVEAMLYDLLEFDLTGVNLRNFPKTGALMDQKLRNLDSVGSWWLECLYKGTICNSDGLNVDLENDKQGLDFDQPLVKSVIYSSYKQHTQQSKGKGYHESMPGFFKEWKKYDPFSSDKRIKKQRYAVMRSLKECRKNFEKVLEGKVDWNESVHNPKKMGESPEQLRKRANIKALPGVPIEEEEEGAA